MKKTLKKLSKVHGREKLELAASMMKGESEIHEYVVRGHRYHNLYLVHRGKVDGIVALTAHHDVVNPLSDNCLDNNASVYNLIRLSDALHGKELARTVVIALVDAEETCDSKQAGATKVIERFAPEHLVDLELTAAGGNIVQHRYGNADLFDGAHDIRMPLNNAELVSNLPGHGLKGSVCLSILDDLSVGQVHGKGYCDLWTLCHSEDDVVELADAQDMRRFRDWLAGHLIAA